MSASAGASATAAPVLAVRDLAVSFADRAGPGCVQAVAGVSFDLHAGRTLAVVGESGSGKSVSALAVMGLVPCPPGRIDRGTALLSGRNPGEPPRDLFTLPSRELRRVRGREIAMIFQEPMTALNPVYTIGEQIVEALRLHQPGGAGSSTRRAREHAARALADVGMTEGGGGGGRLDAYPHEFSGGMRQRVMIAMALACGPRVLLADEPTTALDVSVQRTVLDLIARLCRERGLAVLLITHALGVAAERADTVCVMYAGRVVEHGPTAAVLRSPRHPYTRALLACAPSMRGHRPAALPTVASIATPDVLAAQVHARHAGRERTARPWWPGWAPAGAAYAVAEVEAGHGVGMWWPDV